MKGTLAATLIEAAADGVASYSYLAPSNNAIAIEVLYENSILPGSSNRSNT